MKLLLDIEETKVKYVMDLLKDLAFVNAKPLTDVNAQLMLEIREAVEEMKQIRSGKMEARDIEEFLDEL